MGLFSTDVEVNSVTGLVYVTNQDSDTLSILDSRDHKPTVGIKFNVAPPDAGEINCGYSDSNDREKVSQNYKRYITGSRIECVAQANSGYEFSSWSGDYDVDPKSRYTDSIDLAKYGE